MKLATIVFIVAALFVSLAASVFVIVWIDGDGAATYFMRGAVVSFMVAMPMTFAAGFFVGSADKNITDDADAKEISGLIGKLAEKVK